MKARPAHDRTRSRDPGPAPGRSPGRGPPPARDRAAATRRASDLLASLADPARLRLMRLLEAEELAVGEAATVVQLPQSTVSRHLKALADAGWVRRRSEGTAALFRVVLDDLPDEARGLWVAVRQQLASVESAQDDRRLRAVLAGRRLDSQAFFGRVRGEWDTVRRGLFGDQFTASAMLSLVPPGWVVADLGCGTGNVAELLAPAAARVIAVDRSGPMLKAARRRLAGVGRVDYVEAELSRLPLPDRSADAAVFALVLHHIEDPLPALREARRILRTDRGGGRVLIVDMVEHDRDEYRRTMGHQHLGFSEARVDALVRAAGFGPASWRDLPPVAGARGPTLFVAAASIDPRPVRHA